MKKEKTRFAPWFTAYSLVLAALGLGAATHQRGETLHNLMGSQNSQIEQNGQTTAEKKRQDQYIAWMDLL